MRRIVLLVVATALSPAAVAVPITLTHTGFLLDAADHPLTQPSIAFGLSIWDDPGSTLPSHQIWPATGESGCTADVANGYYAIVLDGSASTGCGASLSGSAFPAGEARYLQLSVGGVTLTPRLRLGTVSAGYAAAAGGGLTLVDNAFAIAPGGVTNGMLANSTIGVTAGTGLSGGGSAALGGSTSLALADTGVTPGTYSLASVTVDQQGRITAASNGSAAIAADSVTNAELASDRASLAKVTGGEMSAASGIVTIGATTGGFANGSGLKIVRDGPATLRLEDVQHSRNFELQADGEGVHFAGLNSSQPFQFEVGAEERLRIDSNGNVGIGTTAPGALLHVYGTANGQVLVNASGKLQAIRTAPVTSLTMSIENHSAPAASVGPVFGFYGNAGGAQELGAIYSGWKDATGNDAYLGFATRGANASVERLRIDSSGNVGLGNTNPQSWLSIGSGIGTGYALTANSATQYGAVFQTTQATPSSAAALWVRTTPDGGTTTNTLFRVQNDGKVGIGVTIPTVPLEVNGHVKLGTSNANVHTQTFAAGTSHLVEIAPLLAGSDNTSAFVIFTAHEKSSNVPGKVATWVGLVSAQRGSASTATQISKVEKGVTITPVAGVGSGAEGIRFDLSASVDAQAFVFALGGTQ